MIRTDIATNDDPMFSMWRISWIAHALRHSPAHLLDGNVFHPSTSTLTQSDATLLEGVLATPLLWASVSPTTAYNLLLLGGIAASGVAMFLLARGVIGGTGPALVSAAIFTMTPYRIEHFMHLELQWAMWIPLTFWSLHRAVDEGSVRRGALAGLFLFLQIVSCVYYGVFLAIASSLLVLLLGLADPRRFVAALPGLAVGGLVAVALTAPYAWPYVKTARMLGPRDLAEVASYSATPLSYLTSPPQNWLWGWTSSRWGGRELSLYPGIVAVALALAAIAHRPRRLVWVYWVVAAGAVDLSFGVHGWLYPVLLHLPGLQGLRVPARWSVVACCAIALLAGLGVRALQERVSGSPARAAMVAAAIVAIAVDFANTGMYLMTADKPDDATVYRIMRSMGPGVVIELPLPVPEGLPGRDAQYEYWSIAHWYPLVNGYSGYYPPEYIETLDKMRSFPNDQSIDRLKTLDVRYIVVHRAFYQPDRYTSLALQIGQRRELRSYGAYRDPVGVADLFALER